MICILIIPFVMEYTKYNQGFSYFLNVVIPDILRYVRDILLRY